MNENSVTSDDDLWPLIDQLDDGVLLVGANPWRLLAANSTLVKWLGIMPDELICREIAAIFEERSRQLVLKQLDHAIQDADTDDSSHAVTLLTAAGDSRSVVARFCRIMINHDVVVGIVLQDSQTGDAGAPRLDPLTGLLDRTFLNSRLTALLGDQQTRNHFAVLFVDVNNFKEVNDRHGHLMADIVLREAARRIAGSLEDQQYVVRYGGDEFVVLLEEVADKFAVQPVIDRIVGEMAKPIALPDGEVTLSLSVGVAMASPELRTPEEMLAAADRAMYAAKRGGLHD